MTWTHGQLQKHLPRAQHERNGVGSDAWNDRAPILPARHYRFVAEVAPDERNLPEPIGRPDAQ